MKFSATELQQARQQGDELADSLVSKIYQNKTNGVKVRQLMGQTLRNDEALNADLPDYVHQFFAETATLPSWADARKMKQGAQFFQTYAREIMAMLGYLSLPYCYAAADGAKVLWQSERTRKDTFKRLTETAQFVFDVMDSKAFESEGFGLRSIQKVRLLHAAIRFHVSKKADWDSEKYGLPVNQEDMAGTNLAFSLIILRGLRKMGKTISFAQSEAYLHLWDVISYLMGIEEWLIPANAKEAHLLERKISARNIRASQEGTLLTQALIESFDTAPPIPFPKGYHTSFMRFMLGDELADMLELPPQNWTGFLMTPQKFLNVFFDLFQSSYQPNREKKMKEAKEKTIERFEVDRSYQMPESLGENGD